MQQYKQFKPPELNLCSILDAVPFNFNTWSEIISESI